jgi:pimeloyl-ACP methyl ester carboxylesterase
MISPGTHVPVVPGGIRAIAAHVLDLVWRERRLGFACAAATAAATAAVLASAMPRGPLSATEGLVTMAAAFAVGAFAGLLLRSRWAMLLTPVAFAAGYELARLDTDGPTVDALGTSTYGLMALAVGRGVHGLVALAPMSLGAALGAGLARRLLGTERPPRRALLFVRRSIAIAAGVGLVVLAVAIARPATTSPILGPDGEPLVGSIAELTRVEIGGHDLAMMIRGHSTHNPVLLFLAGGPGGSELGAMRRHLESLEQDFVVVTWDQRGTGKSYDQLDPAATLTLKSAVSDTIEVTSYLRNRFGQEKIYLVGQSWGSTLGVLAVQQHPELYKAFVGVGQMVSQRATDRIFYRDTLAWAREAGKNDLVAELTKIGPPPYASILPYETALSYEHDVYPYDHSHNAEGKGGFSENLLVEEYTLLEQVHTLGAMMDTFSALYPQLQEIEFRRDARRLDVPVYLVQGRHEAAGRAVLANEWFRQLRAPHKQLTVLATSGHRPLFEQPREFHRFMVDAVVRGNGQ